MKNAVFWDVMAHDSCRNFPPKRPFLQEPPAITSQKTAFYKNELLLFIHYEWALVHNLSKMLFYESVIYLTSLEVPWNK
jgi:hypothetical protein